MTCKLHKLPIFLTQGLLSEQLQGECTTFRSCAHTRGSDRTHNADVLSRKSCRPSESACNAVVLRTVNIRCAILISGP